MLQLLRSKEEIEKEQEIEEKVEETSVKEDYKLVRRTFLLDELYVEALRIYTYNERLGLSEYLKKLLSENIPDEVFDEAKKNIAEMKLNK